MITVQVFKPADNRPGTAYGPYLASILEAWLSDVNTHGSEASDLKAYERKSYVYNEINSLKNAMTSDMGQSGRFTPVYTLAIIPGVGVGAFCKRGNGGDANKHKIELILSMPANMRRSITWPSPSPTSILVAEAATVAQTAAATLKLDTENDDLIEVYERYRFARSGPRFGTMTPMSVSGADLNWLVAKYRDGWGYARPLPSPPPRTG